MILIKKIYPFPNVNEKYAQKVFIQKGEEVYSLSMGIKGRPYPRGVWIKEEDYRNPDNLYPVANDIFKKITEKEWIRYRNRKDELFYPLGFHVYSDYISPVKRKESTARFLNEDENRAGRVVWNVIVRNIIAEGMDKYTHDKGKIYIAQEIFIYR
jgi:hypothetical protein